MAKPTPAQSKRAADLLEGNMPPFAISGAPTEPSADPTPVPTEPTEPTDASADPKLQSVELGVSVGIDVGVRIMTFTKRKIVLVATLSDQVREYDMLTEQLEYQIEHWTKEFLAKIKQIDAPGSSASGGIPGLSKYTAKALIMEVRDGKKFYKVQTTSGKYMRFGCPIYDEQMREYGIAELMGSAETMALTNVTVWIEDRDRGGAARKFVGLP